MSRSKRYIEGRESGCIKVQKTSDNAGGKPTGSFSLQHKTIRAFNYAQGFGTTSKESLKRLTNWKWATLTKSRIVPCQILLYLCQLSKLCLSHRCKQWQKIENFRLVFQRTILKKRINSIEIKRDLCHQLHGTMSCYLLSFLKAKTFFLINWIPKILVQFCYLRLYFGIDTVSRRLLQYPSSRVASIFRRWVAIYCKDRKWIET